LAGTITVGLPDNPVAALPMDTDMVSMAARLCLATAQANLILSGSDVIIAWVSGVF
jgi:hypothetical protein